jgi:hypothetical protein
MATPGDARTFGERAGTSAASDTVRGVVFDSLLQQPLAGATVIAEPGGASVVTDDQGRFTIGGPARVQRLVVFHSRLDLSGISGLSATLDSATRSRDALVIATPSLATLWPRLCPGTVMTRSREGIVFGVARAADGSTRVSGARVRANWESDALSQAGQAARVVDTRTDSVGTFYACGVPPLENLQVVAYAPELSSSAITLAGDSMPIRRLDLVLGVPGRTGPIRGMVLDQRQAPLPGAVVELEGLDGSVKADQGGRFQIPNAPTGSRMMQVRAVGFTPVILPVDVLEKDGEEIRVELERTVILPGVRVKETNRVPVMRMEFEERRKSGFGYFLDSAQFRSRFDVRSIFQGAPGVTIDARSSMYEYKIYLNSTNGVCLANIYLDGFKSDTRVLSDLQKDQVAAVEIYLRPNIAPAKYLPIGSTCGVILVWTKSSFKR